VNLAACAGLPRTPENRVWYRLIDPAYLAVALGSAHTKKTPARFNPGPLLAAPDQFATLSLADDPIPAQFEAGAVLGSYKAGHHVPHPRLTFVSLNVNVVLREVVDLTEVSVQTVLGTNAQELTGDWEGYQIRNRRTPVSEPTGIAPTQDLGRALLATGIEGFRAISAKMSHHKTLVVFTDNLRTGSSLTFSGPAGVVHRIPQAHIMP
jgi:RES domain